MKGIRIALAAGLSILAAGPAMAEEPAACETFAWSVASERAAFAAPNLPGLGSGSALPDGAGAVRLSLKPAAEVAPPIPPTRAAKPETYGGFVTAALPAAGTYQVTLSDEAWIDVQQAGGTPLKPTVFSGRKGCPEVRKSLRFALGAGSVTIQITGASSPTIKLDLRSVE